ncbi:MAG: hypothetical protein FJ395_11685 [Verrucomicrobia bacterium]|nr:hypothetical protein [Verrucomicrobiota bacterium]
MFAVIVAASLLAAWVKRREITKPRAGSRLQEIVALCLLLATAVNAQTVVREWRPDELARWSAGKLKDLRVADGALQCETQTGDSMLISPPFDAFPATPWQSVELVMKSDVDGRGTVFWTGTTQTTHGGFSPGKETHFNVVAGNWQTYRLEPYWQAEGKLVRLRLDFPEQHAGRYAIKSLRILERPATGKVSLQADDGGVVCVRMAAKTGDAAVLSFASRAVNGLHRVSFPIRADGRMHTYNVDVAANKHWCGEILMLELPAGATATVGPEPQGPPDLDITFLGLQDPWARAGKPVRLEARVTNRGGEPARDLKPELTLARVRVLEAGTLPEQIEFGVPATLTWTVQSDRAVKTTARLSLGGATRTETLVFRPESPLLKADYVPAPKPAQTDYLVGAYYFPGWHTASRWARLRPYPERQPLLGWYREGDSEVADWHIKWALEHGINFFLYDWYWDRERRHLEHALHDGLFHARYQNLIKFCLLYANHNPQGSHSPEDFEKLTQYWIENYFKRPNYLTIDGKPAVVMFSSQNPARDMGTEKVKPTFERMRQRCRDAGLGGLYLVACINNGTNLLQKMKDWGYDAVSGYNWPRANMTADETAANRAPFATCIDGYRQAWDEIAAANVLPLIPPVSGGWDARPWHGEATLVRTGRTPELFERHLRDCKKFLDRRGEKMLFIEAWNEWGEGSYIEPHREFGFGYLEAVRNVFAPRSTRPAEIVPADVGLGPYDLPEEPPVTAWTFTTHSLGWSGNVENLRVAGSALRFTTRDRDPILNSPALQARALQFPFLELRVKASCDIRGQLFWRTSSTPESEANSVHFPIRGDGQFHDIRVRLAENRRWRGIITGLRFDPGSVNGVEVAVEFIRLTNQ